MRHLIVVIEILAVILVLAGVADVIQSCNSSRKDHCIHKCDDSCALCMGNCSIDIVNGTDVNCDINCSSALTACERNCSK